MANEFKQSAIEYHEADPPGKLAITPTKPLATQRDLSLAYSPGVAFACEAIVADNAAAARLTARANLVGVVTNGTAVLGLGNIGPLASKPVMEGKAVLFKKFAGIDVFDIEVAATDPDRFVDAVAALEPTFGAINLEDIKAPECFEIEHKLRERMKIPVMHDDQHGTAIVVAAAILNGLKVVGKDIGDVRLACCGGGAAALACLNLLVSLGMQRANIFVSDRVGVVYEGRTEEMNPYLARYARPTLFRKLAETMAGADIFLGLSAPRVVTSEMVQTMADRPIIMALANPTPEIMPDDVKAVRSDAIIATGRSDYPNQVNNVLCFPFLFRGALDAGATTINEEMKKACVMAIAELAQAEASDIVLTAYGAESFVFGPDYIIPKPFDPRLISKLAPAVAKAAMDLGVATRPIQDFDAYFERLSDFVYRTGLVMKPIFDAAKSAPKRVIFAEGERVKVLQAAYQVLSEGIAKPILVGNRRFIEERLQNLGLPMLPGRDIEVFDPLHDPRVEELADHYFRLTERKGVLRSDARIAVRRQNTVIAAMLLKRGEGDAMICGSAGRFDRHLKYVGDIIGRREGVCTFGALSAILLELGDALHRRHAGEFRPHGRRDRRNRGACGAPGETFRSYAESCFPVAFEFWQRGHGDRAEDARGARPILGARPGRGGGRRNAGGRGLVGDHPWRAFPELEADRRRQCADHADARRRQYQLQHDQDAELGDLDRADPARRGFAGACADAVGFGSRARQHDGRGRRGGKRRAGVTGQTFLESTTNRGLFGPPSVSQVVERTL